MRYLLDTNVLIHLANYAAGYQRIAARMAKVGAAHYGISAISAIELYRKIKNPKASPEHVARLQAIFAAIQVYPFSKTAARHLVDLEQAMHGMHIGPADMQIAAHALAMGAVCITDNTEEFRRVPGIKLANWRKARD